MNILFFAHLAGSPHHGMVYGHYYLAREWVKSGHEVTIVAASYTHIRLKQPVQHKSIAEEWINGIRYVWIPVRPYKADGSLGRIRSILEYTYQIATKKLPVNGADVVICSSHHPFPIYTARHYARKFSAKLIFEVRDLWPLTLIELGNTSRHNPFIVLMQRAEDYAYKHADKVISVLPYANNYMIGRGMAPERFTYIPNGANLSDMQNSDSLPPPHKAQIANLRKQGKFIIGYSGKVGISNALHTLIDAMALLQDKQAVAVILGTGPLVDDLKEKSKSLCVSDQIIFLGAVNKNQVNNFLQQVDVAYAGVLKSPLYRFGISLTKINDFMLAGKPIVYAVDVPGNAVELSGAGMTCPAESPEELARTILAMKNLTADQRKAMGEKGRAWIIANRDYKILAARFLEAVK